MGHAIELTAADGFKLSAYRAEPSGTPRGGLVVVQEIFGVNSHVRSVCDGYASDGYRVIAPALFDRIEGGIEIGYTPEDIARGRELKATSTTDNAMRDIAAATAELASAGKVGIVGYCWGGFLSWVAASRVPGLAAAIAYYGGGMTDAVAETPKCPVMAHFGEWDKVIPIAGVDALKKAHPDIEVFIYAADHGFNCDQRGSYEPGSARLARERSLEFLRENVG
jgi:carboxymethylenebutenolidase